MQAIVLTEYGDANQLQLKDWPEPEPGAGQIKFAWSAPASIPWIGSYVAARQDNSYRSSYLQF
jgi:NADPH:quinone reductase-like Zn-dependent oxidoreductase